MYGTQQSVYASGGLGVHLAFSFYIWFRPVGEGATPKAAAVINTGRYILLKSGELFQQDTR